MSILIRILTCTVLLLLHQEVQTDLICLTEMDLEEYRIEMAGRSALWPKIKHIKSTKACVISRFEYCKTTIEIISKLRVICP